MIIKVIERLISIETLDIFRCLFTNGKNNPEANSKFQFVANTAHFLLLNGLILQSNTS